MKIFLHSQALDVHRAETFVLSAISGRLMDLFFKSFYKNETNVVYLKSDLFRHSLSLVRQHDWVTVSPTLLSS